MQALFTTDIYLIEYFCIIDRYRDISSFYYRKIQMWKRERNKIQTWFWVVKGLGGFVGDRGWTEDRVQTNERVWD